MSLKIYLAHLETNVTSACQLRCTHCNHYVALDAAARPKPFMLDPVVFERDLVNFSRVAEVERFGFLGGEPLLHPDLPSLIAIAKSVGIAKTLEVWTNGLRLQQWTKGDWGDSYAGLFTFFAAPWDELVLSRYPEQLTDDFVYKLAEACKAFGKKLRVNDETKFPNFTQLLKTTPGRAQETYEDCWFRTYSRVLDNGFLYQCCCGPYVPRLLLGLPEGTDGLRIDDRTTFGDVVDYLNRKEALLSCAPCAGRNTPDAVPVTWGEERDPVRWVEKSRGL